MRTDLRRLALTLWLPLLATSCATPTMPADSVDLVPSGEIADLPSPAAPGSGEPRLFVGAAGVHMSWLEPTADGHAVRVATLKGDRWSGAGTVVAADDLFVNWADFPSLIALEDGTLAAHWLQKSGPETYAYDVRMALSRDDGLTWSEDILPHRDSVRAEHGFVSLFPLDGGIGAVWLDGRETVTGHPMTLRSTSVGVDGSLREEVLLDASTCDCCQTDVAIAGEVPVAVYRGRTADEVRDIMIVRRVDGEWTAPVTVHDDGWVIAACPVNGPAIDASGQRIAVAWFTAAGPSPGQGEASNPTVGGQVLLAFSDDGGATFGDPVRVDGGGALGRVDLRLLGDGSALVVWLERTGGGGEIRFQAFDGDGAVGEAASLTGTSAERVSGFPRMAARGNRILFAYTEPPTDSTESRVRTIHASVSRSGAGR